MMVRRQSLHKCPGCGATIGAMKTRCAPCADERMRVQANARNKARRQRQKLAAEQ